MTDNLESAQNQGAEGQPSPKTSGGEGGSPTSTSEDVLLARLEKKMESRLQSMTDKRLKQADNQISDIQATVGKLKPYLDRDMSLEEATRQVQIDELLSGKVSQSPAPAAAQQTQVTDISAQVIESLGFDPADEEVAQIRAKAGSDLRQLGTELKELVVSRATAPTPNPAANAAPTSGQTASVSKEKLQSDFEAEMLSNIGNMEALVKTKQKYAEKGLDVY